jgi:hypothetical protein
MGFKGLFATPVGDVWYMRRVWGWDPKSGRAYSQTLRLPKERAGFLLSFWRLYTVCIFYFLFYIFFGEFSQPVDQKKRALTNATTKGFLSF